MLPDFTACQTDPNKTVWLFVGTSSALAVLRLTAQHLSHCAGCLVFMGHGTPSAVAGGSVASAQTD